MEGAGCIRIDAISSIKICQIGILSLFRAAMVHTLGTLSGHLYAGTGAAEGEGVGAFKCEENGNSYIGQ